MKAVGTGGCSTQLSFLLDLRQTCLQREAAEGDPALLKIIQLFLLPAALGAVGRRKGPARHEERDPVRRRIVRLPKVQFLGYAMMGDDGFSPIVKPLSCGQEDHQEVFSPGARPLSVEAPKR